MTNYLANLVRRSFGYAPSVAVQPVYAPYFPPVSGAVSSAKRMMLPELLNELAPDVRQSGSIPVYFEEAKPETAGLTPLHTGSDAENTISKGESSQDRMAEVSKITSGVDVEKSRAKVVDDEMTSATESEINKLPSHLKTGTVPQKMRTLEEGVTSVVLGRENQRGIAENDLPSEELTSAREAPSLVQPEPRVQKEDSKPGISSDLSRSSKDALFEVQANTTHQRGISERSLQSDQSLSEHETVSKVGNVRDIHDPSIPLESSKLALKKPYPQQQRSRIASVKVENSQIIGKASGKSEPIMSKLNANGQERFSKVKPQSAIVQDVLQTLALIRPVISSQSSSSESPSKKSKPAPVHVQIGTIEVHATPLPRPESRPAPKPQGFGNYLHLRNYATWEL